MKPFWKLTLAVTSGLLSVLAALPSTAIAAEPSPSAGIAAATDCAAMAHQDFSQIPDAATEIVSAELVPADDKLEAYCKINGIIQPQIQFEMRLPSAGWNGRYLQLGCGGFCGEIYIDRGCGALGEHFAVAADNMGHVGGAIKPPIWGSDPQLRVDFGGRATHVMSVVGKALAARYYGSAPRHSYFQGCSTGGREGLMEAQRYPDDFDGIIAGDAAFPGRLGAIANNWDAQHLLRDDGSEVFTKDKLKVLNDAILKKCDALDGVKDGILMDPRRCHFDVSSIACPAGTDHPDCLTAEQVGAAEALYQGPVNSHGERLMPGATPLGSELSWSGRGRRALAEGYLRYLAFPTNPPADYNYRKFDFDRDPQRTEEMAALYDPVAPHEAPDLRAFEAHGGRLIVYHGWADAGVSPFAFLDYYSQVSARQGGMAKVRDWFRVFMIPGMFHCRGGNAPNTFDTLGPIVRWVEDGEAPKALLATQTEDGQFIRSRPVFPYPDYATYKGSGDVNLANNWVEAKPAKMPDDRIDWFRAPR